MGIHLVAEAGLSECARTDIECMPGFGIFLVVAGLLVFFAVAHLVLASLASGQAVASRPGTVNGVLWVVVIWIIPLGGPAGWFVYARHQGTTSSPTDSANSLEP